MKQYFLILVMVCAGLYSPAQTNFVKNPGFELYDTCPYDGDQITLAKYWSNIIDTTNTRSGLQSEYYNACTPLSSFAPIPSNGYFYQYPHAGNGMAGACFYFDKSHSVTPPVPNYREYLHGRLSKKLESGISYCVTFYVNMMEMSAYAHNKIGAYLDNGSIDRIGVPAGSEITSLTPQIYTDSIIKDTVNWIKIEGTLIASGSEIFISIGNFFTNPMTSTIPTSYWGGNNYSYYLIDDVSVIESDLPAKAGPDNWVEELKSVAIGRVGDTTAEGLDCKWYHRGNLIDSGAIITVQAGHKGDIDTYAVVQTICGNIKTDTVLIHTVGVGMQEMAINNAFSVYPNPTTGQINISSQVAAGPLHAGIYNLLGQSLLQQTIDMKHNNATLNLSLPPGTYLLELTDAQGHKQREKLQIQ